MRRRDTGEGCPEGEGCYLVGGDPRTGTLSTGCRPTRSRLLGEACARHSDCESGLVCLEAPGVCVPVCRGIAECAPSLSCVAEEDGSAACRRLCVSDDDCGASARCVAFTSATAVSDLGTCR